MKRLPFLGAMFGGAAFAGLFSVAFASTHPHTLADGLQILDLRAGHGAYPKAGQTVRVQYVGRLTNGTKFDASSDHGGPFEFVLGQGQVIAGWDEGVKTMRIGGLRRLTVPPALAYGNQSVGSIPPNSTLIFDIELLSAK